MDGGCGGGITNIYTRTYEGSAVIVQESQGEDLWVGMDANGRIGKFPPKLGHIKSDPA